MDDDFYNEQEQWDNVKAWVRQNGLWVVAGVAIGVGLLVGWRWWNDRIETRAVAASVKYSQMLDAFARDDSTRAITLADELRTESSDSPYAEQADLAVARSLVEKNELGKAEEHLTRVMNNGRDQELRLVARLRVARVQLAANKPDLALATLGSLTDSAFAVRAEELRGDALLAKGDRAGALKAYLAAKAREDGAVGTVTLDVAGLELKISDLQADGVKP